ncbi:MAG: amino acid carrier protein [Bacilli bacterium]|nr:amino acid carrier protein [Bacilli bacterium]
MNLINKYIWVVTSSIIILISIYFSIKEKFPQLNIKHIFKSLKSKSNTNISVIESLMMSLASRIGVGSIAGIALAIKYGGIGSIFWIWIITILISSISYIESYYGEKYTGGPHYYIAKVLNKKILSRIYAIIMIISYGIGFITIQTNTIATVTKLSININKHIINISILLISIYFLYSNTNKKSKIVSKIVPIMTLFYFALGICVIINNSSIIICLLKEILKEAISTSSIKGSFIYIFIIGMQRAIFSTEVAIGTSAISSAMVNTKDNNHGYIQIFGNYITTFIICTITALIILSSNYNEYIDITSNGIELAFYAFYYHFKDLGQIFIWICIFLFAISTVISGFYYGENCLEYLTKNKKIKNIYKTIVIIFIIISTYINATEIWILIDISVAILCLINLYAIIKIYRK